MSPARLSTVFPGGVNIAATENLRRPRRFFTLFRGMKMHDGSQPIRFETSTAEVSVHRIVAELPAETRRHALACELKDFRYYAISAETLAAQFEHRFLVLKNKQSGQTAVQPVFVADQDLLDGLPEKYARIIASPRKIFPRWLKARMLFAGASAGTGALDCTEPWAVTAFSEALEKLAREKKCAMILLKDFSAKFRTALQPLADSKKFRRVPSMPACVLDFDFKTFEEYMSNTLGRKLRYKYLKLNKQPAIPFEIVADVTAIAEELHALYLATHNRSKMRFEKLTPEFFARVGREMPDRAKYFIWRVEGKIVAFALCFVNDGVMDHLNIGFDYAVAFDLQLYYVTIRDIFRWCLANGVKRYETGQLNYDPKFHLQMKLLPLDLYARHTSRLINPLLHRALGFLQPTKHEKLLKEFPNFNEL